MKLRRDHAFSLVEVTLALGVAAVSLLAIFSLLPIGLETNKRSADETDSANILSAVVADLRATPVTNPRGIASTSPQFGIGIPGSGNSATATLFFNGAGQFARSQQSDSRYRVTITSTSNGGKAATFVHLQATWPAGASITNAQGSAEMIAAFDRN